MSRKDQTDESSLNEDLAYDADIQDIVNMPSRSQTPKRSVPAERAPRGGATDPSPAGGADADTDANAVALNANDSLSFLDKSQVDVPVAIKEVISAQSAYTTPAPPKSFDADTDAVVEELLYAASKSTTVEFTRGHALSPQEKGRSPTTSSGTASSGPPPAPAEDQSLRILNLKYKVARLENENLGLKDQVHQSAILSTTGRAPIPLPARPAASTGAAGAAAAEGPISLSALAAPPAAGAPPVLAVSIQGKSLPELSAELVELTLQRDGQKVRLAELERDLGAARDAAARKEAEAVALAMRAKTEAGRLRLELDARDSKLKQEASRGRVQRQALEAELSELRLDAARKDNAIESLKNSVALLTKRCESTSTETLLDRRATLQSAKEASAAVSSLRVELSHARAQAEEHAKRADAAAAEVGEQRQRVTKLQSELSSYQYVRATLEKSSNRDADALRDLNEGLLQARDTIRRLETDLAAAGSRAAALAEKNTDLTARHDRLQVDMEALRSTANIEAYKTQLELTKERQDAALLAARVETLEKLLKTSETDFENLKIDFDLKRDDAERLAAELEEARRLKNDYLAENDSLANMNNLLRVNITHLEEGAAERADAHAQELAAQAAQLEAAAAAQAAAQAALADAEARLRNAAAQHAQALEAREREAGDQRARADALQTRVAALEGEADALRRDALRAQAEQQDAAAAMAATRRGLESTRARELEAFEVLRSENCAYKQRITALSDDYGLKLREAERLKKELAAAQASFQDQLGALTEETARELAAQQARYLHQAEELDTLRGEAEARARQLSDAQARVADANKALAEAGRTLTARDIELSNLRAAHEGVVAAYSSEAERDKNELATRTYDLELLCNEYKSKYDIAAAELVDLGRACKEASAAADDAAAQLAQMRLDYETLGESTLAKERKLRDADEHARKQAFALDTLAKEKAALAGQLERAADTAADLQNRIRGLERELGGRLAELAEQGDLAKANLAETNDRYIAALTERDDLLSLNKSLERRVAEYKGLFEREETKRFDCETKLSLVEGELQIERGLRTAAEGSAEELAAARTQMQAAHDEAVVRLNSEIAGLTAAASEGAVALARLRQENAALPEQQRVIDGLRHEVESLQEQLAGLEATLAVKRDEMAARYEALLLEKTAAENEYAVYKTETSKDLIERQTRIDLLMDKSRADDEVIATLREQVDSLGAEGCVLKNLLEEGRNEIVALSERADHLADERDGLLRTIRATEEGIAAARESVDQKVSELEQTLADREGDCERLRAEYTEFRANSKENEVSARDKVRQLSDMNTRLAEQVRQLKNAVQGQGLSSGAVLAQTLGAKSGLGGASGVGALAGSAAPTMVGDLEVKLNEARQRLAASEVEIERLNRELLSSSLSRKSFQDKDDRIGRLADDLRSTRKQLEGKEMALNSLQLKLRESTTESAKKYAILETFVRQILKTFRDSGKIPDGLVIPDGLGF